MKRMVQYKVKPDRVAENERLVRAVYDELRDVRPPGLRYATMKLADGVSFVHVVTYDKAPTEGNNPLTSLPSFKAFAQGVGERSEAPAVTTELEEIGSYGFTGN